MLIICLAALIARMLMLAEAWRNNPLATVPIEDARVYWDWAAMIDSGRLLDRTPFHSAPLYPYFLGLIRSLGGGILTVYVVQTALHLVTAVLIGRIGFRRFGLFAGLLAASLFVLLTEPAFFSGRLLNCTWQLFLVSALWIQLIAAHERPTARAWTLAGGLVGLNCLANPTMLPALFVIPPWAFWRSARGISGLRPAAAALAAAAVVIAPATVHNYMVCEEFIPVSAQAGLTFYQGNCPGAAGTYTKVPGISGDRQIQNLNALRRFREATGQEGSWNDVSRYYYGQGVDYLLSDPPRALGLLGRKAYWFVTGRNYGDIYIQTLESDAGLSNLSLLAPLPTSWMVIPAILSLLVMLRRWKQYIPELLLFAVPLAIVSLFWYSPRYRLPAVPVIVVAAAWALCLAIQYKKHRPWTVAVAIGLALAIGLGRANEIAGFDDIASCRPTFEQSLGLAYAETGNLKKAREHFEKALEIQPDYAPAQYGLGNTLREMGRHDEAIEFLEQALLADPDSAGLCNSLSKSLRERGRLDEAIKSARRSVELDPDQPEFHNDLGIVLAEKKEAPEAIHHFHLALQANPMMTEAYFNLGLLYANLGRQEEALRCCAQAVRLDPGLARAHGLAGMILLERGRDQLGIEALQSACDADPNDPVHFASLAMAQAAKGRFVEAVQSGRKAVDLAEKVGASELLPLLRERVALYQQGICPKE